MELLALFPPEQPYREQLQLWEAKPSLWPGSSAGLQGEDNTDGTMISFCFHCP